MKEERRRSKKDTDNSDDCAHDKDNDFTKDNGD